MFQGTQKICLRRLLASCSVVNLCNLFTSLQPLFSPCKKGLDPRLPELILVRPCEALNQYSVFCLTYSWKNILHYYSSSQPEWLLKCFADYVNTTAALKCCTSRKCRERKLQPRTTGQTVSVVRNCFKTFTTQWLKFAQRNSRMVCHW